jgi:hypothetical protein
MVFAFSKDMDRDSVENRFNWTIGRAENLGGGQDYNFGMPLADTEVNLPLHPEWVYYDPDTRQATVSFKISQNSTADGTIDPSHIQFQFSGKDAEGYKMDPAADQYTSFSGVY